MMIGKYIPSSITSVSIVGNGKNAGKTTVLNALLREFHEKGERIAIASAGVDGERTDAWSGAAKPPIVVQPGDLAATSRLALQEADARFEILEKVKGSSIGHEVYIVRATKGGRVKLAGTPTLADIQRVLERFRHYGSRLSIVDGAYDRRALACPAVTGGVILAIGAAGCRSLSMLIDQARELVFRLTLPEMDSRFRRDEIEALFAGGLAGWWHSSLDAVQPLAYPLMRGEWQTRTEGPEVLFLPGALTNTLLQEFVSFSPPPAVVVRDGTRLQASWPALSLYFRKGGRIFVLRPIRLLAVCINPSSPDGYQLDPAEMAKGMKEAAGEVPVIDVVRGWEV